MNEKTAENKAAEAAEKLGLNIATSQKEREYDLVESLLEASSYRDEDNDDNCTEAEIKRRGKFLFSVHLHPIGEDTMNFARKKATTYTKNPQGAKYPPIEKEFNGALFNSWVIYLATTKEDQDKIWGNKAVKNKYGLMQNVDTIDILLRVGEKTQLTSLIDEISGFSDEDIINNEEIAKN